MLDKNTLEGRCSHSFFIPGTRKHAPVFQQLGNSAPGVTITQLYNSKKAQEIFPLGAGQKTLDTKHETNTEM